MSRLQVVWFKRDIRLEDHPALSAATACGPVLGLVVYEPSLWAYPDASGRQAAFYAESLESFRAEADRASLAVLFLRGEMPDLLSGPAYFFGRNALQTASFVTRLGPPISSRPYGIAAKSPDTLIAPVSGSRRPSRVS